MLTESDLDKVLELARLEIDPLDKPMYLTQLSKILSHMEHLNQLDLSGFSPVIGVHSGSTPCREDHCTGLDDMKLADNAPEWENGFFSVPKILDH